MTAPPSNPEPEPEALAPTEDEHAEDWVLSTASPLLGLAIAAGFAIGVLVGIVKDLPPVLGGVVTVLIGARAAGRLRG